VVIKSAHRVAGIVFAGALLLAACTGPVPEPGPSGTSASPAPDPTSSITPPDTPHATASPLPDEAPAADVPPFHADTEPDTSTASADAQLSPVNLRFGTHEGYDRIVLDLVGTGTPGWLAEYNPEPRTSGSGEVVDLEGDVYLVVHVSGVVYPTEAGAAEYEGPMNFEPRRAGIVEEVVYGPVFEGQMEIYIGLSSEQPFRVFLLEDPTRVVIDIVHP
jgi:hypothetical protein